MSRNTKITLITVICLIVISSLCTIGYILSHNISTTPVFLSKNITDGNLKQFVIDASDDYFEDKTIRVKYENYYVDIPVTDFAEVDIAESEKKIKAEYNAKSKASINDNEILPVFQFDSDKINAAILNFAKDNSIGTDFYAPDDSYKTVTVDLTKETVDINSTVKSVFEKVENLDFSDTYIMFDKTNDVDYLYEIINTNPKDAEMTSNGDQIEITKERIGFIVDKEQLEKSIKDGETNFTVNITEVLKPEITEEDFADKQMFEDVLSTCSSYYSTSAAGRVTNVELAASKINCYVMQPGDVFSYNNVVGPRTYERGFKNAGVYTANGLENGVGGGICQVSSTLYGAQLMADLKTVTRTNHSYTISYLPTGQDATVAYGTIDYKFENSLNTPIKIECTAQGGLLTVKILGIKTDSYREIKLTNEIVSTRPFETVEKEVEDLKPGEKRVAQEGQNGMVVNTYKVYYKDGVKEKSEFVHKSTYIPMPKIVEIGKQEEVVSEEPDDTLDVDTPDIDEENTDKIINENDNVEEKTEDEITSSETENEFLPENDTNDLQTNQNFDENAEIIVKNEENMIN